MRPHDGDFDDELRAHLTLAVRERVERGEDPDAARRAALAELGYIPAIRESMRRVWYARWVDGLAALGRDLRIAVRSLRRARSLALTVVATLALGIGANVAIFSVVREVLLRPLANRDEERLLYVRQSAPGLGAADMTFSMAEIRDLAAGARQIAAFGDFSAVDFTLQGLGEPRTIKAGVVNGRYFEVMGLRPVLGRLLGPTDDGPTAAPVVVLTHAFWTAALHRDPAIVGKVVRLGSRAATIVGVLEPSLPYPTETALIANVVTSPHHLGASMVSERTHRMTELFARLAPGATLAAARAELTALHAGMMRDHAEAYPASAGIRLDVTRLRDQLAAPARGVLLVLLATAGMVFVIACANVANLILARSVRRESELAVRVALGAGAAALRRTLLAESLLLGGAGAAVGVLLAFPLVAALGRFAARFSVRALDAAVDAQLLWIGAALAVVAAAVLAYVPRLPSPQAPSGQGLGGGRIASGNNRRLRAFAITQIAFSFVLLAGAGVLLSSLTALATARATFELRQVLAVDIPTPLTTPPQQVTAFSEEVQRRVARLPGVERVAIGSVVPWRDAGRLGPGRQFTVEGFAPARGEEYPFARFRNVSPGFFAALGVPLVAGRDFTDDDRMGGETVAIVSESLARRIAPGGDVLNRHLWWVDPVLGDERRRIVGVVADLDDESVVGGPVLMVYNAYRQLPYGGRLFVRAAGDPYALVAPITKAIRDVAADQPVERAATLGDVRTEVLAPERLNAFVLSGFAGVALLIAVVGVAGVLAFSVSARTRELGVRLAIGATPRRLLRGVLGEGLALVRIGLVAGVLGGFLVLRVAKSTVPGLAMPGPWTTLGAAAVLGVAALGASLWPALRAARVDLQRALRPE